MTEPARFGFATALNLLVMGLCVGSFMWGAVRHFRRVGGVPMAMSLTSIFTLAAAVWLLGRVALGDRSSWWGAALLVELAAAVLFWWAVRATDHHRLTLAFSEDLPSHLITLGPYGYIRHPFYASYIMFWIAAAANVEGLAQWLIPIVAIALYLSAAMKEERKFSRSGFANDYSAYRSRTGMILPRLL